MEYGKFSYDDMDEARREAVLNAMKKPDERFLKIDLNSEAFRGARSMVETMNNDRFFALAQTNRFEKLRQFEAEAEAKTKAFDALREEAGVAANKDAEAAYFAEADDKAKQAYLEAAADAKVARAKRDEMRIRIDGAQSYRDSQAAHDYKDAGEVSGQTAKETEHRHWLSKSYNSDHAANTKAHEAICAENPELHFKELPKDDQKWKEENANEAAEAIHEAIHDIGRDAHKPGYQPDSRWEKLHKIMPSMIEDLRQREAGAKAGSGEDESEFAKVKANATAFAEQIGYKPQSQDEAKFLGKPPLSREELAAAEKNAAENVLRDRLQKRINERPSRYVRDKDGNKLREETLSVDEQDNGKVPFERVKEIADEVQKNGPSPEAAAKRGAAEHAANAARQR